MKKIETSSWKDFKIYEIFYTEKIGEKIQVPTGAMIPKKNLKAGNIPRITVSNFNNGITGYYKKFDDKNYRLFENFISVSFLGTVFYQECKVSLDMKVHCLKPINYKLNKYTASFLVSVIRKAIANFEFSDQLSSTVLPLLAIKLPKTQSGEPNWEYMESYMRNIIQESEQNIENLRNINNSKKKINLNNWKSFTIGKLFENVVKPPVLHTKDVTENVNGIPYVVRTKFDNGIKYNVEKKLQMQSSPAGTISFGAENATFFYQEKEYVSGRDIYYIDTRYLTKYACLFVVTCLQTIVEKYSYNYGMFPELVKKEEIKLPVNKNGEPDWEYMENYMKNIMQESEWNIQKLQKLDCCK